MWTKQHCLCFRTIFNFKIVHFIMKVRTALSLLSTIPKRIPNCSHKKRTGAIHIYYRGYWWYSHLDTKIHSNHWRQTNHKSNMISAKWREKTKILLINFELIYYKTVYVFIKTRSAFSFHLFWQQIAASCRTFCLHFNVPLFCIFFSSNTKKWNQTTG